MTANASPRIVFIANLWTLVGHPAPESEWSLARKVREIRDVGFAGINCAASPEVKALLQSHGMRFSAGFDAQSPDEFAPLIREQMDAGAETINVQLANHDTPVEEAIELTLELMAEAGRQSANVHLEVHRDTCTETPEKAYAIPESHREPSENECGSFPLCDRQAPAAG